MFDFVDKVREHPAYAKSVLGGGAAKAWVQEHLWPIYSLGAAVSVLAMLAAAQEKQILADHLYGSNHRFAEDRAAAVEDASRLLDVEIGHAVRHDVWAMEPKAFEEEHKARHGQ